ncbi:MAG TPA: TIGR00730 family Rossman fold protein, partial [Acidimicrobiales bacterium]|nr:TIGR00730 family Rossman fold protein [Acidimicrobiales bacterium]
VHAVAVYCASSTGSDPRHAEVAAALGRALADHAIELVYGGGHVGLMGVVADAALAAGGRVTGVITESLMFAEVGHAGLSELLTVPTMHERKALMSARADAFVMLPGGYGTLDEFFEAVTWSQLGIHDKPCIILDPTGYYAPLMAFVDNAIAEGFVKERNRALITYSRSVDDVVTLLRSRALPNV